MALSYTSGCATVSGPCDCSFRLVGEADAALQTITGVLECRDSHNVCHRCRGQQQPITLTRQ